MKNTGLEFSEIADAPNMLQTPGTLLDVDSENLLLLMTAWPTLPDAIKAGIMAMVESVAKNQST